MTAGYNEDTRRKELFEKKSARVAASYLRRIKELPDMPKEMEPFLDVLENVHVHFSDVEHETQQKTVGTFCIMVPNELIYAAGGVPVRLCSGSYTAYAVGDETVPRDACPLVKAVMGMGDIRMSKAFENCSLLAVPITCDCKKKIAGMLKRVKPTVMLHVPPMKGTDADMEQYLQELYRLVSVLEKTTGNRVTEQTLAESINQIGYAQYEMSRFLKYRRCDPALLHGTQVMAVMNSYAYMPVWKWAAQMGRLNAEMEKRLSERKFIGRDNQPRILITGSPVTFPNIKVPLLIEEMGGRLVADETCLGERALYDPVTVVDNSFDGMMRALAGRYTRPCDCPVFVDNKQRLYRIRQMIKAHKVDGVVYHVLRGCLVYDYEYKIMEEELGAMDIPVIRVESDYNEEDVEQLRIRIEAFIELIKLKNYAKQKKEGDRHG
ncbi:MAG: 2-hydroxyacyl-CoA dehydratase [Lachnospiraceae bacterium]|nr:2-hydroxyacyl-CoA dehydratase [Lachnospiraceae bacterium]